MAIKKVTKKESNRPKVINTRAIIPASDERSWTDADVTSDSDLAKLVIAQASTIERYNWRERYASLVYSRYLSGRETAGAYSYSLSARPASVSTAVNGARWRPPTYNAIGTIADVFSARIFKSRPCIMNVPLAEGGFKARVRCKRMNKFTDAIFDTTNFWDTAELIAIDAMEQGPGIVKVHEDYNRPNSIAISRVLADELLISDDECLYGEPNSMLQRVFMHRRDLMARYGTTDEARRAIKSAPSVHTAFGTSDGNHKNIVCLIEGWSKPLSDGTPGKHVLCVNGYTFVNEGYTRNFFPFAIFKFSRLTTAWRGQGLCEQLLPLQAELDRCMSSNSESNERVGYPRALIESGSQVSVESLAGLPGGVITYTGQKPEFISPASIGADNFRWFQEIEARIFKRAGISEQAAGGVKPSGVNSGIALMAWSQIDDSRHADLAQRFESWVTNVAKLVYAVAEDVKPKVTACGKFGQVINWEDIKLTFNPDDLTSTAFSSKALALSRLPSTVSGREQTIQDWLANGQITKETAMRAGLLPDVDAVGQSATAIQDQIEWTIDSIIDEGEFIAPNAFGNLNLTLQTAQSRYATECTLDTPQDRLQLLLKFISCVSDLISDSEQPPAPAGIQGAAPLAPSPLQVTPAQGVPNPIS